MVEWSITPVLKTGVPRGTGGSNPSLSATMRKTSLVGVFLHCKEQSRGVEPLVRHRPSGRFRSKEEKESLSLRKALRLVEFSQPVFYFELHQVHLNEN